MKVGLTIWENRISQLFDWTRMLLIVDIVDQTETRRHFESPFSRAAKLSDLGIEILICGAVLNPFANMI